MKVFVFLLLVFNVVFSVVEENDVGLSWALTVRMNKGDRKKEILKDVTGAASFGRLHAIVGPSGSGKSSLLNALAGVTPKGSLELTGEVTHVARLAGVEPIYVEQEDLLFPQLTVEETLKMSIALRVPRGSTTTESRARLVDSLIRDLGLKKVRHTRVGDAKTRGISGGEKKRLAIGNEIIRQLALDSSSGTTGSPRTRVIFADEPTSGLDSFQAQKVMQILSDLARAGNVVIVSIHQPRATVFDMFDDITLLSEGRVVYSGAADNMATHFGRLGYPLPDHINPCEHYVDLIAVNLATPETEAESHARINTFANAAAAAMLVHKRDSSTSRSTWLRDAASMNKTAKTGIFTAFSGLLQKFLLLFGRAFKTVLRDKPLNIARLSSSVFSGLLFGVIYNQLPTKASSIADRLGLLQVAAVNCAMTSLIKATTSFVSEKLIIQRERRSGAVSVLPYFLSKLVAELPISACFPSIFGVIMYKLCGLNPAPGKLFRFLAILVTESFAASAFGMAVGSLVPSVESGVALAPALMVVFIVFGGLYVVNVPPYLKWLPNASLIRWSYQGLVKNEFDGLAITPEARGGALSASSGEEVLKSMNYDGVSVRSTLIAQSIIIAVNYAFTVVSLLRQHPSSEPVLPYMEREEEALGGNDVTGTALTSDQKEAEKGEEGVGKGTGATANTEQATGHISRPRGVPSVGKVLKPPAA